MKNDASGECSSIKFIEYEFGAPHKKVPMINTVNDLCFVING